MTGPTNDLWTVTGDVTAKAAFGAKKYMVKASAVSSNSTQTASGTITLEPSGEQPYGTEVRIASAEGQNGARLLTILANGKELPDTSSVSVSLLPAAFRFVFANFHWAAVAVPADNSRKRATNNCFI